MRRTKIVCTIGPASRSPESIENLIKAGMNVARLNFSHETRDVHGRVMADIRHASDRLGIPVAVMQDLAGPKIRIGAIADGPVTLVPGDPFTLTAAEIQGNARRVSITYPDLPGEVRPGDRLLLSDGELELVVEDSSGEEIHCTVVIGGRLASSKGINLPTRSINAPSLTDKDCEDLAFGVERGVDYVALSFVRTAGDVEEARALISEYGGNTPVIAKIEKREALENIEQIIRVADGLIIARGDLGVETPIEEVPKVQKMLITMANRAGKSVTTATQMLKSMVDRPGPTRAEVTDVANAILDGSDAVMLSEETAVGNDPVRAVEMMSRIAESTEEDFPFHEWTFKFGHGTEMSRQEAVAHSACQLAEDVKASAIIACTRSGSTTRLVSKYRPRQPIIAMTPDEITGRQLTLTWGSVPLRLKATGSMEEMEREALALAFESGFVKAGDTVVLIAGYPLRVSGTTNLIKISTVKRSPAR